MSTSSEADSVRRMYGGQQDPEQPPQEPHPQEQKPEERLVFDSTRKTWTANYNGATKDFYGPKWRGVEEAEAAAQRWLKKQVAG